MEGIAVKNRRNVEHFCDEERRHYILDIVNATWLLSIEEHNLINKMMETLVRRIFCYHMKNILDNTTLSW